MPIAAAASPDAVASPDAAAPLAATRPPRQRTLASSVAVAGIGFVFGGLRTVRFLPADGNHGLAFARVDLEGAPRVPASLSHVVPRQRRTALQIGPAVVEMTEHVLAALHGLGIDNCLIEIDGPETPGMDGSSAPFVEALLAAGIVEQDVPRRPLLLESAVSVRDGGALVAALPSDAPRLDVTYHLDYGSSLPLGQQSYTAAITPDVFARDIAPARTFILEREIAALRAQGLGIGATAKDLLVFDAAGQPIDNALRFPDECVRHKILDVVGDLALLGRPLHGHVLADKSGHALNVELGKRLLDWQRHEERSRLMERRPLMDAAQIEKILPHRYPFLLVDRVLELDPNRRAAGIKNVSYNEPFFVGHWPGRPVMPGVLIVEAMAQLAGIMLTQWQDGGNYGMIVGLKDIKLRRAVVPGDQLWLEAEAVRVKERAAVLRTRASVGRSLVAEAEMRFVLVSADDGPGVLSPEP